MSEKSGLRNVLCAVAAAVLLAGPANAQLLRGLSPPPVLNNLPQVLNNTVGGVTGAAERDLSVVRDTVGRPRSASQRWDRDPQGAPFVRGEIVAVDPSPQALAAARALSFTELRRETIGPLAITVVVLRLPDGMAPADAMAKLRAADPQAQFDYNHICNPVGAAEAARGEAPLAERAPARIGLIDGGVDGSVFALRGLSITASGFAGACKPVASDHGTAVAALLRGASGDPLRASSLFAADVYCGRSDGGSAESVVRALGWMASSEVAVVNISLAGPPNSLLAAGVRAFVARGHVLVAAAGNDGPSAGPRYPAAYPGVIAVTAVDDARHIMLDANQGDYIAFAARGVKVKVPKAGGGSATMTGTSFAAPVVARRIAVLMEAPDAARAAVALCRLRQAAVDLGAPGRDPVYGYGYLSETETVPPAAGSCLNAAPLVQVSTPASNFR